MHCEVPLCCQWGIPLVGCRDNECIRVWEYRGACHDDLAEPWSREGKETVVVTAGDLEEHVSIAACVKVVGLEMADDHTHWLNITDGDLKRAEGRGKKKKQCLFGIFYIHVHTYIRAS